MKADELKKWIEELIDKIDSTNTQATKLNAASETASAGKGKAFNNMPPYVTVYAWERTS